MVFYVQEKYDEAIQAFDKAIEINPSFSESLDTVSLENATDCSKKGHALAQQGKYDEAIKAFDNAIKIYLKTIETYPQFAIEINPRLAAAWINKGIALCSQDKYDEGIQAFDRAIEIEPQLADAWYNKGIVLKLLGRTTEADEAFDKANELGYTDWSQHYVVCINCNPFPLFSICFKLQDIIIKLLPTSNSLMVRGRSWMLYLLLQMPINRDLLIVNPDLPRLYEQVVRSKRI